MAARLSRLAALPPSSHSLSHFAFNLSSSTSAPLLLRALLSAAAADVPGLQPTPALHWNDDAQLGGILRAKERVVRVEMARPGRGYVRKEGEEWNEGRMSLGEWHARTLSSPADESTEGRGAAGDVIAGGRIIECGRRGVRRSISFRWTQESAE
jgi:hypothetical protein